MAATLDLEGVVVRIRSKAPNNLLDTLDDETKRLYIETAAVIEASDDRYGLKELYTSEMNYEDFDSGSNALEIWDPRTIVTSFYLNKAGSNDYVPVVRVSRDENFNIVSLSNLEEPYMV